MPPRRGAASASSRARARARHVHGRRGGGGLDRAALAALAALPLSHLLARASSAARSAAAAAAGSAASRIARTTTMRSAPAAVTCRTLTRSMPPIANQGRSRGAPGGVTHVARARPPGRPCLVGVSHTGPTLSWSASRGECALELLRRVRGESHEQVWAHPRAHCVHALVVLAHVHAVGAGSRAPGRAGRSARTARRARRRARRKEHGRARAARRRSPACRAAAPCPRRPRAPRR